MDNQIAPSRRNDLVWLTGWVFADLLLGLGVIFMVSLRGATPEELARLASSGNTPTPTATRTALPTTTARTSSPTAIVTGTRYPTYTPYPANTRYPTYTPYPTLTPFPTWTAIPATPALSVGLDPSPYVVRLQTDPTLYFSSNDADRQAALDIFRKQAHACLDGASGTRAGLVLGTGYNVDLGNGHDLAQRAMVVLRDEFKGTFGTPSPFAPVVMKDFHAMTDDALVNGKVVLEIYFLADQRVRLPTNLLGQSCDPPPKTWCQGIESSNKLIVYNWSASALLDFSLDGQVFKIKSANGTVGTNGVNRTVGCIMVTPGAHSWRAGSANGSVTIMAGIATEPIRICGSPPGLCTGGTLPTTTGPGVK